MAEADYRTFNLKYNQIMFELIDAVNKNDWVQAYERAIVWENLLETILLLDFCEPNTIDKDFNLLRRLLDSTMPAEVKRKRVRDVIARILEKISPYGLAIGRVSEQEGNKASDAILSLLAVIDNELSNLMMAPSSPSTIRMVHFSNLKRYLNALERLLGSLRTDRIDLQELAEYAMSELQAFRSVLSTSLSGDKSGATKVTETYQRFMDMTKKLARALRSDTIADVIVEVFQNQADVQLSKARVAVEGESVAEGESVIRISRPAGSPGELTWIDEEWESFLTHPKVILIIGHRNQGKSALAHSILEYYAKKYGLRAYLVNVSGKPIPPHKLRALPDWVNVIESPEDAPTNAVILYDEAYARFHARTTHGYEAQLMDKLVELSRHKRWTLIYVAQQTSKIDRNIISAIDLLLIKRPTIFRVKMEKAELREFTDKAMKLFERLSPTENPREYVYVYCVDPPYEGLKKNGLASYWSEELSTFYEGW